MSELYIETSPHHPIDVFGLEEEKLNRIRRFFPQLNIILRGDLIKAVGDTEHLADFEEKMKLVLFHFERFNRLNEADIDAILGENKPDKDPRTEDPDLEKASTPLILMGVNGKPVRALTANQQKLVDAVHKTDMVFAIGPAGSGKTYTAVALAVKALKEKEVKRIILTRPAVEAGENLGFLPGDMKEKLDPYMQPLYDALRDMIPYRKLLTLLEESTIEIAPLAFMRGRTLDHAFVILDEAQNATESQMKMFLTRMGKNAKFVITGDITQADLPRHQRSGLVQARQLLHPVPGIAFVELTGKDVVRHRLVARIIEAYAKHQEETPDTNAR
ncbi:MAG: PhoH family protein [Bacteroides sp.]|nr:PhoH family protein [Bacteroides sp.]MCM1085486.1 PhoH family protein [Bacteroides sp.]MCM1169691.1 PhoH family protein [Bacteroides sp.]